MRPGLLLLALGLCLALTPPTSFASEFTLYLVRHAEKQDDGSRDPALTAEGQQRADKLAAWLEDKSIENVWSSDFQRTRDTALPTAGKLGLGLNLYDPLKHPVLIRNLLGQRHTALVVGHSNTIPKLARMLCECEIADMDEDEYDRLIVITGNGDQVQAETLNQTTLFEPASKE
ncbi:MAG: phosphoglycerate mutase family protein [Lysobacterales bacterium]|jgi:broad specificity phosphatase PhoE